MTDAKISMTEEELAEFVDARISEDRAKQAVEREPAAQAVPVTPASQPREPMSDDLAALFGKALDLAEGDVGKASQTLLGWVDVDFNGKPIDPRARSLFLDWYWIKVAASVYWRDIVGNVMTNIQRKREREKVA